MEANFPNDITIFRPYATTECTPRMRDFIIRHELWHLIEQRKSASVDTAWIMEGTADFAADPSCSENIQAIPPEICDDFDSLIYSGALWVVRKHMAGEKKPLRSILDPAQRELMQGELLARSREKFFTMLTTRNMEVVKNIVLGKIKKLI